MAEYTGNLRTNRSRSVSKEEPVAGSSGRTSDESKGRHEFLNKGTVTKHTLKHTRTGSDPSSTTSVHLMTHAFSTAVTDNIIAGPHGALQSASTDRWSQVSTTTTLLRRFSELGLDEPVEFEAAVADTGHGRFQHKLMALCGLIYACCSLSTTTLSLVLPTAQYDFDLSSVDKGSLNTAPLWGMVAGAYIWGYFADNKGRRFVLLCTLIIDCIASFVSSFCQTYEVFYTVRIFNGFAIIGATSTVFAYLGEFLDYAHRDMYLARLELFWTVGIIALPCIGLAILPLNLSFGERGIFMYNSWRMFVFACGIPSLIAVVLISRMPESPRFFLLHGKLDETRQVLEKMFLTNTRKSLDKFFVRILNESAEADTHYFQRDQNVSCWTRFKNALKGVLRQHIDLFSGRSLFNIIIVCFIDFGLISVSYTTMLWVPELLNRMKHYVDKNPGINPTICMVAAIEAAEEEANSQIEMETFLHTIITCMACLPTTLMLLCLVELVSKKALLAGIMLCAAVPAICLARVKSIFQVVTMLSLLRSLTNLAEAILFCAIVHIFPINTRGTALSLTVTIGRIGSIFGNIIFGFMIDTYCSYVFYGMGVNLVLSGLASILLPKMVRGH